MSQLLDIPAEQGKHKIEQKLRETSRLEITTSAPSAGRWNFKLRLRSGIPEKRQGGGTEQG